MPLPLVAADVRRLKPLPAADSILSSAAKKSEPRHLGCYQAHRDRSGSPATPSLSLVAADVRRLKPLPAADSILPPAAKEPEPRHLGCYGRGRLRFKPALRAIGLVALAVLSGLFTFTATAQVQRVNLAKYQTCAADSEAAGEQALFATDGVVGNGNRWKSDPAVAGPHWLSVTLPLAMQVGSVHLYLGRDDTEPVASFSLQYRTGGAWLTIPGTTFSANTATVLNVVFGAPITAAEFRFYTTDSTARVRELALFATNGPAGFPLGTDVTLNLAKKRRVTVSSVDGTSYGKGAVDGYVQNDLGRWKSANANGPHTLEVDLQESTRLGSAHLYLGSSGNPTVSNFTLEYWTGSAWTAIPGGAVTANTNRELRVNFTSPVAASLVRLNIPDNGAQRVRELALFAAATGVSGYPLGTDVIYAPPPTNRFDTRGDGFWKIVNRALANSLIVGPTGASQTQANTTEPEKQFQLLYNLDSDTFRLRNRDSWKCIQALNAGKVPGTAVVEGNDYHALPHELWRFEDLGSGYFRVVNVWSGLALQTDGASPATVALATPSTDTRQQWQLNYQTHYPKKGIAGYEGEYARFGTSWSYNWGRDPGLNPPASFVFTPMQYGRWWPDFNTLPDNYSAWHTTTRPLHILGYNEPEQESQGNTPVEEGVALWPKLEQTDLPLVSPAPVNPFTTWIDTFFSQINAQGLRVDFTAIHWYANPDASGLVSRLQSVYNTYGRPVWLTEFSNVDWGNTATWTDEDCYRFLMEFTWRAEDLIWLKRYSLFPFSGDLAANPWDRNGDRSNFFLSDGSTLTPFGEYYAAWDADRTLRDRTPFFLQGLASMHRLRDSSTTTLPSTGNLRRNDVSAQFALVPNAAGTARYVVSLRHGRRLRFNGTTLDWALPGTTGSLVEWTFNGPDGNGYTFIDHPATSKSLRLQRINDGNGVPTALNYTMEPFGSVSDETRWRFLKPYQPVSAAPPVSLSNLTASASLGRITLAWSLPAATNVLRYSVYRRATTNGPYALVATNLAAPGFVDTNVVQATTYRYVVTVTDWLESESPYSSEALATPPGPRLDITPATTPGFCALTWPAAAGAYRLMKTTNLTFPIRWTPVSGATLSNGLWNLAVPIGSNPTRFFRIQWP